MKRKKQEANAKEHEKREQAIAEALQTLELLGNGTDVPCPHCGHILKAASDPGTATTFYCPNQTCTFRVHLLRR